MRKNRPAFKGKLAKWEATHPRAGSPGLGAGLTQSVCACMWLCSAVASGPPPLCRHLQPVGSPKCSQFSWDVLATDPGIWEVGGRTWKLLPGGLG